MVHVAVWNHCLLYLSSNKSTIFHRKSYSFTNARTLTFPLCVSPALRTFFLLSSKPNRITLKSTQNANSAWSIQSFIVAMLHPSGTQHSKILSHLLAIAFHSLIIFPSFVQKEKRILSHHSLVLFAPSITP